MSDNNVPVWTGDIFSRPELYWPFSFKDKQYVAVKSNNDYLVIDIANEAYSLPMTIRLFPSLTGHLVADILMKSEMFSPDYLATALENNDDEKIASMVASLVDTAKAKGREWLKSKGISSADLMSFLLEAKKKILMTAFSF